MTEASSSFFLLFILALVAVVAVFAMKYTAAAYRSRLEAKRQGATDEVLGALRQDIGVLTTRVNTIEKLLREVE